MTKKEIKILMIQAHNVLVMDYHDYLVYKKDWLTLLDDTAFNSYVFTQLEAGSVVDADADRLRDILLFHIIKGEYSSYNGVLSYEPVHVLTLWNHLDAVMTIKLNNDKTLSSKRQDKVTLMDQCGASTVIYARTSDLLMTNGPAHILSRNCVYVK